MREIYKVEQGKLAERPLDEILDLAERVANSGYNNVTRRRDIKVQSEGKDIYVFILHSESSGDHGITGKQDMVSWFHARKEHSGMEIIIRRGGSQISYDLAEGKLFYKAQLDLDDMEPEALEELTGLRVVTPQVRMAYIWQHLDKIAAEEDEPEELSEITGLGQVADSDAAPLLELLKSIEQAEESTDQLEGLLTQEMFRPVATGEESISDTTAKEIAALFDKLLKKTPVETFSLTTRFLPNSELSFLEVCRRKDTMGEDYGLVSYQYTDRHLRRTLEYDLYMDAKADEVDLVCRHTGIVRAEDLIGSFIRSTDPPADPNLFNEYADLGVLERYMKILRHCLAETK